MDCRTSIGLPRPSKERPPNPLPFAGLARDAERFKLEFDFKTRAVFDTEEADFPVSNAYGLTNVPTVFLIQRHGGIAHTGVGWSKSDVEEIAAKLGVSAPFRPEEVVLPFQPG